MAYQSFEELKVWKRSTRLSVEFTNHLVDCNDYAFKDQVLRSTLSIPSNITEGSTGQTDNEQARFCHMQFALILKQLHVFD